MLDAARLAVASAVSLLVLALSAPLPLAGQPAARQPDPPGQPAGAFTDTVEVNLVSIDVVVTGRDGAPISGLGREDFVVLEDGKRVEITHFETIAGEAASSGEAAGDGGAEEAAGEPARLVLYVDNFNTRPHNRTRVLESLRGFLAEKLAPGTEVMVASYDNTVSVHLPFTSDRTAVAAALDRVEALPAKALDGDAERRFAFTTISSALEASHCAAAQSEAESYASLVTRKVNTSTAALEDFIGALGGIDGRKALVYVSDGLEMRPGSALFFMLSRFCGTMINFKERSYDTSATFRRLGAVANDARVTFYTLESLGTEVSFAGAGNSAMAAQLRKTSRQDALRTMAEETGGVALLNANRPAEILEPVLADAGSYYSLGFVPAETGTGETRSLEVKVQARGARVRYRRSYQDKLPVERVRDQLQAALLYGTGTNPLAAVLETAGEPEAGDEGLSLPLRLAVPIANLTLIPEAGIHRGRLTLYVTGQGSDGTRLPVHQKEIPVTIPDADLERARDQLLGYPLRLAVTPGRHEVVVALRDEVANVTTYVTRVVEVPAPARVATGAAPP